MHHLSRRGSSGQRLTDTAILPIAFAFAVLLDCEDRKAAQR